jgi:hypothetical protein
VSEKSDHWVSLSNTGAVFIFSSSTLRMSLYLVAWNPKAFHGKASSFFTMPGKSPMESTT